VADHRERERDRIEQRRLLHEMRIIVAGPRRTIADHGIEFGTASAAPSGEADALGLHRAKAPDRHDRQYDERPGCQCDDGRHGGIHS